jgi:DNA-binding SARP family transcriptional activator
MDVPVDVLEFQRAADRALAEGREDLLRSAATSYTGDLLPELAYLDLFADRRATLASRYQAVVMRLAEQLCRNGAAQEGLALFSSVLESDPLQEAAVRGSMRALTLDDPRRSYATNASASSCARNSGSIPTPGPRPSFVICSQRSRRPHRCPADHCRSR